MHSRYGSSALLLIIFASLLNAQVDSFSTGGLMRNFIVHVPSGLSNPSLVINMHGLGSNASQQQLYTRFDAVADREKFITVYPNGIENSWDIIGNRDVSFILALIDTIHGRYTIDRDRVYATGFSMGGYMSHRLGCAAADRIAAIGPVAGLNASSFSCSPARPIPVMQIHGTADSTVRYSGVAATISGWVSRNGCPSNAQVTNPYPASNPGSSTRRDDYSPCDAGSAVVLLTVTGAGHVWPGGYGATSWGINAAEELWAFFKNYALPSGAVTTKHAKSSAQDFSVRYTAGELVVSGAESVQEARLFNTRGQLLTSIDCANRSPGSLIAIPVAANRPGFYVFALMRADGAVSTYAVTR